MKGDARILVINNLKEAAEHIAAIGAEEGKVDWLAGKAAFMTIKLDKVLSTDAIMVKNDMLEMGGQAVYSKGVYDGSVLKTDMIISGSRRMFERLVKRLRHRTANTAEIAEAMEVLLKVDGQTGSTLLCRDKRIQIGQKTIVMGVLEIPPGYDEGLLLEKADQIIQEGADIIDITCHPSIDEDLSLICASKIIEKIRLKYSVPICTDVSKSEPARRLLSSGADIINDIWAARRDPEIARVVASYKAGIILMHNTTHRIPQDVMGRIISILRKSISVCQGAGIGISSIVADPGLGFGKSMDQNLEIVRKLKEIRSLGVPIMVGPSGKSLYSPIVESEREENLGIISSVVSVSIANGADIIRVHDVAQMKNAAGITDAIINK
ncbi:MAG: dihydropteroate synthase [Clostridia bacterium]|nr:dihydropteroate synthase [Clostridia bacterium]